MARLRRQPATFQEEWTLAPRALPLEGLVCQRLTHHFYYQGVIYTVSFDVEPTPKGQEIGYLAIAHDAVTATRFPDSTLVSPATLRSVTPLF